MNYPNRPPCSECPFLKKSLKGWLGPDTPEQVWEKVHADHPLGYPCHVDVEAKVAEGYSLGDTAMPGIVEQCVGALLHAHKTCKRFKDVPRQSAMEKFVARFSRRLSQILGMEFIAHHTI